MVLPRCSGRRRSAASDALGTIAYATLIICSNIIMYLASLSSDLIEWQWSWSCVSRLKYRSPLMTGTPTISLSTMSSQARWHPHKSDAPPRSNTGREYPITRQHNCRTSPAMVDASENSWPSLAIPLSMHTTMVTSCFTISSGCVGRDWATWAHVVPELIPRTALHPKCLLEKWVNGVALLSFLADRPVGHYKRAVGVHTNDCVSWYVERGFWVLVERVNPSSAAVNFCWKDQACIPRLCFRRRHVCCRKAFVVGVPRCHFSR